jgi:hypothetical protein
MREFYEENKKIFYIAIGFSAFCFGFMLTHYMVNIDEETWILNDASSNIWLLQNRYILYLYDLIFTKYGRFVPFFSDVVGIVLWNLSGFVFSYVFFDFEPSGSRWIRGIMLCYYSSVPLCVGEAFGFTMQIIPEAFALVAVATSFVMLVKPFFEKKIYNIVISFIALFLAFGTYQAMAGVYITAVTAWCLFRFMEDKPFKKELVGGVVYCGISFAIYYIVNFIIGKIIGTAAYLSDSYYGWNNGNSFIFNLWMAIANVARVSLGITIQDQYIYGGWMLRLLMIVFIVACINAFFLQKNIKKKIGTIFFTIALVVSPFVIYILLGTYKTHGRMLIALSLSGMVEMLFIYKYFFRRFSRKLVLMVFGVILIGNASNMNQIFYNSYLVYQHDKVLADEIIHDIEAAGLDYHTHSLVLVGAKEMDDIGIYRSGSLSGSLFDWDGGNIARMIDFMKTEGYCVKMPTYDEMKSGYEKASEMSVYPKEGSIIENGDSIVVYLSEPSEKWITTNLGE